jgi:hypothetical protein
VFYDSIYNNENKEKVLQITMKADYDNKDAVVKAAQDKKDAVQRNIRYSAITGILILLFFLGVVYRQRNKVKKEKDRSEELLLNILPSEVAE